MTDKNVRKIQDIRPEVLAFAIDIEEALVKFQKEVVVKRSTPLTEEELDDLLINQLDVATCAVEDSGALSIVRPVKEELTEACVLMVLALHCRGKLDVSRAKNVIHESENF